MCAIVCGQTNNLNKEEVFNSLKIVNYRGPDDTDAIFINNIFLGHNRLSIVDVKNGKQPLSNEFNTIFACVNGEFYNYLEIKQSLKKKGHIFKTNSDSEILIHLYEEYGTECLKYLNGEFSFVLYDKLKNKWFLARDRFGIRPLQYYLDNKSFFVASEAKSLLQFNDVYTQFDKESFWFSQHLQYLPLDKTLFKNISMVKPAHFILIDGDSLSKKEICYWDLKNIPITTVSFQDAVEKSSYLLEQSVINRIPKEVSWTTHLSGGIDSSIVTSIASKNFKQDKAFTIAFTDDDFYNEHQFAQQTADYCHVDLVTIPTSFNEIINYIPIAVYHSEGLSINGHLGAKYLLNKIIKEHGYKVAITGEGSDEIFMGYSHLKQDYLSSQALKSIEKQYLTGFQLPDENTLDLSSIYNSINFVPTWLQAKSSMGYKFKQLWHKNFNFNINPYDLIIQDLKGYSSNLKSSSSSWMKYCLNGYILKTLDDAQSMAHSIEGRLPFLDTELVEFMYSIPDELYFHENIEKSILRTLSKNKLPQTILNKTKQSFMSPPINRYLNDQNFKNLIYQYVFENNKLHDLNLFDKTKLLNLFNNKNTATANNLEPIVMTILTLGIFIDKFL